MKPDRYRQVKQIVESVMDVDPARRSGILDRACAGDAELRGQVEALLHHMEEPAIDIDRAQAELLETAGAAGDGAGEPHVEGYRLLGRLGEGGMGVVYLAEQARPRRRVALKVIRPERRSPELIVRFEREAEVLGRLQHPGIAQIFEVGAIESRLGPSPFLVMEYIEGPPLVEYADAAGLDDRARLELMVKVCQAVHHAHESGVVHRDLKPSNILVRERRTSATDASTALDTVQPKVLDFGIARLVGGETLGATLQTAPGQLLGTVAYMSPEQIGTDPSAVDRRSDVYSLGVILGELLTGRLPYALDNVSLPEAGRIITTVEPTLPGERRSVLRGDIDTLVGKALEKEPDRRYQTAADLALDIRRFLDHQPIVARPPSAAYQFRKFARRNRGLVAGAAAVLVTLVLGLVGTSRGMLEAQRQRDGAKREVAVAKAINDFLVEDLLLQADPRNEPDRAITLRTVLDRAAGGVEEAFTEDRLVGASIQSAIARTYASLGVFDEAAVHARGAMDAFVSELGEDDVRTLEATNLLAAAQWQLGEYEDSQRLATLALERSRRILGEGHEQTLVAMNYLAVVRKKRGDWEGAEDLYRQTLAIWRRVAPDDPQLCVVLNNLGVLLSQSSRYDEAEALHREALETRRRHFGEEHPDTLYSMINLGEALWYAGRTDEAGPLWEQVYETRRTLLGESHPDTLSSLHALGLLATAQGDHAEAERIHRDNLERRSVALGPEHLDTLVTRNTFANAIWSQGRLEEAADVHRSILDARRRTLSNEHPDTRQSKRNLRSLLLQMGELDEARPLTLETLDDYRRRAEANPDDARAWNAYAWELVTCEPEDLRDGPVGLDAARRAVELSQGVNAGVLDTMAVAQWLTGDRPGAIRTLDQALELVPPDDQRLRPALQQRRDEYEQLIADS